MDSKRYHITYDNGEDEPTIIATNLYHEERHGVVIYIPVASNDDHNVIKIPWSRVYRIGWTVKKPKESTYEEKHAFDESSETTQVTQHTLNARDTEYGVDRIVDYDHMNAHLHNDGTIHYEYPCDQ